jgi:hypothetical protein
MDTDLRRLLVNEGRKKKRHAYRISGPTLCKELGCVRPAEIRGRCHANFRLGARSTITFEPGKTPVCGSIFIGCSTSRPVVMPDEKTVLRW